MEKKLIYTPKDLGKIDFSKDIASPGEYPFTRGIHPHMYGERLWTMRQFAGFGSAKETNERFLMLLQRGQTGLSVAFDMPTLLAYDSDNPRARYDVGMGGVAVDTLADMEVLFDGIDLSDEHISTSMTINGPATVLLAMYFAMASKKGAFVSRLRGTVQADPFKEFIAQNEYIIPPRPLLKLFVDTVEYCGKVAPNWNPVSISGYHIREAGSSAAQELAFTLANGIAYIDACIQRGMHVDAFAPRFSFFFDFHNDWLEEIAKIRSARRMWARIIKERFGSNKPRSQHMRTHIQTAGITLTQEQPLNNIARVAIQALGAVLAGTQSLHTNSYDEQLNLPSEEAVKVALRTQQIIAHETGLKDVVDPFAGSYAMERMTSDIEAEASALIEEIDNMGGMLAAIESGWAKQQIRQNSRDIQEQIENGERVIIGQNMYNDEEPADTQFEVRPEVQEEQIAFLSSIKTKRSSKQVRTQLRELEKAARRGENCMPFIRNAAESYATLQEIFDVFRELFGTYRPDKIL